MRLPNGYGSVFRLSNHRHRRRPYIARITIGYDAKNHPRYTVLGYYSTRQEGLEALSKWYKEPSKVSPTTFGDAANKTFLREKNHLAESTITVYRNAYCHYLKVLDKTLVSNLNLEKVQSVVDDIEKISMQAVVKTAYRLIENYCLKFNLMTRGFADLIEVRKYEKKSVRVPFTHAEIAEVWKNKEEEINQAALFLLYTGMRIEELRKLKCGQVNMDTGFITCGSKTAYGKNRLVPIHPKIAEMIKALKEDRSDSDFIMPLPNFRKDWERLCMRIGVRHVPHECRHTLRSELDRNGANKVCIDLIMGHASQGIGERVYTHKTTEELAETILKVTY